MATDKKSFILYADIFSVVDDLPREVKGDLFQLIIDYVNDRNPVTDDLLLKTAFAPIKQQLKRDLVRWEETRGKRSIAGKASANKRQQVSTSVESVEQKQQVSTVNVNDTVNVNVNDTVRVNNLSQFFKDLPNSSELEQICMDFKLTKEIVISRIPEFKLTCETEYPTYARFVHHFKNWLRKNPKSTIQTPRQNKALLG